MCNRCGLPPLTSWKARPSELDDTYWLKLKEVPKFGHGHGHGHGHWHRQYCHDNDPDGQVYEKVDDIDLMLGGVAEKNVRGGAVGATFACIIGRQPSTITMMMTIMSI